MSVIIMAILKKIVFQSFDLKGTKVLLRGACISLPMPLRRKCSTWSSRPSPIFMTEQKKKKGKEAFFKTQTAKRTLLPNLLKIACQGQIQILKVFSTKKMKGLGHLNE